MRLLHFMSIALVVGLQAVHASTLKGNETDQTDLSILSPHNLGTSAGTVSGVGLAYRKWFSNGSGFQVAGFPYFEKTTYGTSTDLNIGALALKSFYNTDNTSRPRLFSANVYGYLGGSTRYQSDSYAHWDDPESEMIHKRNRYALGSGAGFEIGIWRIKWNLMTGIGSYYIREKDNQENSVLYPSQSGGSSYGIIPSVETALFFGF